MLAIDSASEMTYIVSGGGGGVELYSLTPASQLPQDHPQSHSCQSQNTPEYTRNSCHTADTSSKLLAEQRAVYMRDRWERGKIRQTKLVSSKLRTAMTIKQYEFRHMQAGTVSS